METALSIYFFHLCDGVDLLLDEEGRECDGHDAIVQMTLRDARSILSEDVLNGLLDLDRHIDVEDADRKVVHHLAFMDAVEIRMPS